MSPPISFLPEINFTNFTYNNSNSNSNCNGELVSYSASQTGCFNSIDHCCRIVAENLGIIYNKCLNTSVYHCGVVSLNPQDEQIVTGFEWTLIVMGGITFTVIILLILRYFIRCICCPRSEYRELT